MADLAGRGGGALLFSCPQGCPDRVPSPPAAEISASPAAEVLEGTATTLSCDVPGREGHPEELSYTWYKNGVWLQEGSAHTLLFPAVAAGDAGYYSCQVTNSQGSDTAQAISLSVTCECHQLLPPPKIQEIPPKKFMAPGGILWAYSRFWARAGCEGEGGTWDIWKSDTCGKL